MPSLIDRVTRFARSSQGQNIMDQVTSRFGGNAAKGRSGTRGRTKGRFGGSAPKGRYGRGAAKGRRGGGRRTGRR
jgi:hypothetical protein